MFLNAVQTFLNSLGHSMRMPPMLLVTCPDHHTEDVMQDWGGQCFERNVQTRIRAHAHASTARPGKVTCEKPIKHRACAPSFSSLYSMISAIRSQYSASVSYIICTVSTGARRALNSAVNIPSMRVILGSSAGSACEGAAAGSGGGVGDVSVGGSGSGSGSGSDATVGSDGGSDVGSGVGPGIGV